MTTQFLTNDMIRKSAPAVFAENPHTNVSESYAMMKTIDVVEALRGEGWMPTQAVQSNGKSPLRNDTNRHYVRFRHVDSTPIMGDSHPEILIMNSHNRASCFQLSAGLYRLVCSNGMVVADSMFETRRYRHTPKAIDDIIEGTFEVINEVPAIEHNMRKFNGLLLDKPKRLEFGRRALEITKSTTDYNIEQLVRPTRPEDRRPSLWNVFNTTQEHLVNGGIEGKSTTGRTVHSRGIQNPRGNVSLNKDLWQLTNDFYDELKAA